MIEVEAPDGTVVEFPDGTATEVITQVMRKQFGGPQAPAAPAAPQMIHPRDERGVPVGDPYMSDRPPSQPAAPAAAAPAAEPDWLDAIMGGLDYGAETAAIGVRGARQGAANILGLPVDAINAGLALAGAPVSDTPFLGSRSIDQILGAPASAGAAAANAVTGSADFSANGPQPQDGIQRAARRIGEEVGAAAVPVAGAVGKAAGMTVQEARQLPGLARLFVEPAAVNPGRFVAKEMAVAAGAGTGAALANETFGRDNAVADVGGALAGAAATGLGTSALKSSGEILSAIFGRENYVDDVVRQRAADAIIQSAGVPAGPGGAPDTTDLVAAIERGPRVEGTIPGFRESLADRTANPGVAALEYGRQSGPNSGTYAQRRSENAQAVDRAIQDNAPTGSPGAFRAELEVQRDARVQDAALARQQAEQEAMDAILGLQPQSTPAQRGSVVRGGLEDARDAARQRTEDAYSAADVARKPVDPAPLATSLDEAVGGLTEVERGLVPQGVIDRVAALGRVEAPEGPVNTGILDASGRPIMREPAAPPAPEPVDLKQATDLKSELQRLQRAAVADPRAERGGRNAARVLGQMIDTVDGFIASNLSPEEAARLDTARGARFDEAERFGRQGDPVAEVLARREGGQPRVRDDQVAGRFVNAQAMDRLFAEADTPAVRSAIRDEVLTRGDLSSPERIQRFMTDYGDQLGRFPGLGGELERAALARGVEAGARSAEDDTLRRFVGNGQTPGNSSVGRYLRYGDENSDKAMRTVLNAPEPGRAMDELLEFAGNRPDAVEGARKVFWDIMEKSSRRNGETTADISGIQPWMPNKMRTFLDDPRNAAVAERLYRDNPEHLENVRAIAEALRGVDLRNTAKAPNTSGTAQGVNPVLTPETIQSRLYAYKRGQISGSFLLTSIAAVVARRSVGRAQNEAVQRMLDDALLNPDAAALLLKENNPANRAALARRAKAWFGNEASTIVNAVSGEEGDDEERQAITGTGR